MTCCSPTYQNFVNETVTTVPYTGAQPIVSVGYLQDDNTMQFEGIFNNIIFTATEVIIDHGGASTGVVKLL